MLSLPPSQRLFHRLGLFHIKDSEKEDGISSKGENTFIQSDTRQAVTLAGGPFVRMLRCILSCDTLADESDNS